MFNEAVTVRAVSERYVQEFGVFDCLLNARSNCMSVVLCFNDRKGNVCLMIENVISALGYAATMELAPNNHFTLGEGEFFFELVIPIPSRSFNNRRRDEFGAD